LPIMILPAPPLDASFEEFLRELPEDCLTLAYEFKAFTRSRKIKTPAQLLQVVMLYCGLDAVLREVAGDFVLLCERITDTAIRKRLMACGPWLKAVLRRMTPGLEALPTAFRLLAVDSTALTGIAPDGTAFRVHLVLDLVHLTLHEAQVSGVAGAERLERHTFVAGDVVLADRGYNHPAPILDLSERQVRVIVRLNPVAMPLCERRTDTAALDPAQARLDLAGHLRQVAGDRVSLPVWLRAADGVGCTPCGCHRRWPEPQGAVAARMRSARAGRLARTRSTWRAGSWCSPPCHPMNWPGMP